MRSSLMAAVCVVTVLVGMPGIRAEETSGRAPQVIVLKLDDVTTGGARDGLPVSPRWQRVVDFLQQRHLKGSAGIIGFSLEEDNPAYFQWIKDLHAGGQIEFWNHGYANRKESDPAGEFERSYEEQKAALQRTQRLVQEKLGIELHAFGPHWSGTNAHTARALDSVPELRIWFYGDAGDSQRLVFKRVLTLENPTFVPDFEKFRERYERFARNEPCLALQGHPNAWDEARWHGFVNIIDFLQAKGCVFMTPSEFMKTQP